MSLQNRVPNGLDVDYSDVVDAGALAVAIAAAVDASVTEHSADVGTAPVAASAATRLAADSPEVRLVGRRGEGKGEGGGGGEREGERGGGVCLMSAEGLLSAAR